MSNDNELNDQHDPDRLEHAIPEGDEAERAFVPDVTSAGEQAVAAADAKDGSDAARAWVRARRSRGCPKAGS